jgi:exodeoxyribonuclease-3
MSIIAIHGQKGYHGVAIISRLPLSDDQRQTYCGDRRHAARLGGGRGAGRARIRIHNFYVPAGGDEPDREINPKFAHKLDFIEEMRGFTPKPNWLEGRVVDPGRGSQHRAA